MMSCLKAIFGRCKMKDVIERLNEEHKLIETKLNELETLISKNDFHQDLDSILEMIGFFEQYACISHHQTEEKLLYHWMLAQNKNSDKELIERIVSEHRYLEGLVSKIKNETMADINDTKKPLGELGEDLSFLISKYREHAERESSFIFVIAESLSNAAHP